MKASTSLLVLILFLTLAVSSLPAVYAHGTVDQKQESTNGEAQILFCSSVGQEFVPSRSPLLAVDLLIKCLNPESGPDTFTVNIRESSISGTILGTRTQPQTVFESDVRAWLHFDLPSPVNLTLGSTYVIELVATESTFGWARYGVVGEDLYPLGRGIMYGNPTDSLDWAFRTYAPSPLGGSVTPIDTVEVLWPWVGLASLVGIVTVVTSRKRRPDLKRCRDL